MAKKGKRPVPKKDKRKAKVTGKSQNTGKRKGQGGKKRKKEKSQRKRPCWEPFPVFAHRVEDTNKVIKIILLVYISLLLCTSILAVCLGVRILNERVRRNEPVAVGSLSKLLLNASVLLITFGLFCVCACFVGFIGVLRENIVLIRVFYIILIVLLVVNISLAVVCLALGDISRPLLEWMFADTVVTEYTSSSDAAAVVDHLQLRFGCCGVRDNGFMDWNRSSEFNCSEKNPSPERCAVPWSCCRNNTGVENPLCGNGTQKLDRNIASRTIYTKGCIMAIQDFARKHAFVVAIVCFIICGIIIAMICMLMTMVNDLQMMNHTYRGPWWLWVGKPRPPRPPPGTPPTPLHLGPVRVIEVRPYMEPYHRGQLASPPPKKRRVKIHRVSEQLIQEEQKVFATSFKGALRRKDETELSAITDAAIHFLGRSADASYFCGDHRRGGRPPTPDSRISVETLRPHY